MYYSDLLFGMLPVVDPWRRGACRSCRKAVQQKREEHFVHAWDNHLVFPILPLCRLQTLYSWDRRFAGLGALVSVVDSHT